MGDAAVDGLSDRGSTPLRSTIFDKEGPGEVGRIPYRLRRRLQTLFVGVCFIKLMTVYVVETLSILIL